VLSPFLLGGTGGLLIVCLCLLGFTLWRLSSYTSEPELKAKVIALEGAVADLADRCDTWMRRDATRAARAAKQLRETGDGSETGAPGGDAIPVGATPRPKDLLRREVFQRLASPRRSS
jgi:hypothetical protein